MAGRNEGSDGAVDRDGAHQQAAETFVRRVGDRDLPGLHRLILFGSTARGTASGLESDVDFLAVVADDADRSAIADELRDLAYDVMLELGPVVEVHVVSRSTFDALHERDHPFLRQVLREGRTHV